MRLSELLARAEGLAVELDPPDATAVEVRSVVHDSRAVTPDALFCCVVGSRVDGHDKAAEAAESGASALLVERPTGSGLPELRVADVRAAMGPVAAAFWDHPARTMDVVGVTGTSGKTTTTYLLHAVFEAAGRSSGIIGTLSGARTTPEAPELQALLAAERDAGRTAIAMEVSSHALVMHRVAAMRFAVSVFTNLSPEHLDFHPDMDAYFEAKASLFVPELTDRAVVDLDDPRGVELLDRGLVPTEGYRLADAEDLEVGPDRAAFRWRGEMVRLQLGGRFNVSNGLAAATAAAALGIDPAVIAAGLSGAPPVPGRFEPIDEGQPFTVLVDYAHKPDALAQALATARDAAPSGRLLLVFGAGGDRDRAKRPVMGEVAVTGADRVLLTSDNPRGEDPLAILDEVRAGMSTTAGLTVEPDRRAAIGAAIAEARSGDVVLIAGKGHERVQIIGDAQLPFDDREVARDALRARRESTGW